MKREALLVLALLLAAAPLLAVGNTGAPDADPATIGHHQLTQGEGDDGGRILYAPSEEDDSAFRAAIAAITGGTVDYFDARAATPDLATMQGYDCVHTWANFGYFDSVAMGDTMADYVDAGGTAVMGAFTTYDTGNSLGGRLRTVGYSPVSNPTGGNAFVDSAYAGDGTTQIHDGVTAYSCVYRDLVDLQGAGAQDGSYLDDGIAHAYRSDFGVVFSNGSGAAALGCTGDWALLIANSCQGGGAAVTPIVEVPTASSMGLVILMLVLGLAGGIFILRRRQAA